MADQTFDHTAKGNYKDNDEESTVRKFFGIRVVAVLVENVENGRAARPRFDRRWVVHDGRYRRSCLGHSLGGLMSIRGGSSDGGGGMSPLPIIGGAVGVVVLIGIAVAWWWCRRQTNNSGVWECVFGERGMRLHTRVTNALCEYT